MISYTTSFIITIILLIILICLYSMFYSGHNFWGLSFFDPPDVKELKKKTVDQMKNEYINRKLNKYSI